MTFGWVMALEPVYDQICNYPDFFERSPRYRLDIQYVAISIWVTVWIFVPM